MPERNWVRDNMLGSIDNWDGTDEELGEEWHLLETGFGCRACVLVGDPGRPVDLIMEGEAIDSYPTVDEAIEVAEMILAKNGTDRTQEQKTYGTLGAKKRARDIRLREGAETEGVDREAEDQGDSVL